MPSLMNGIEMELPPGEKICTPNEAVLCLNSSKDCARFADIFESWVITSKLNASPQILSRGKFALSIIAIRRFVFANSKAQAIPAGPAPTMHTSHFIFLGSTRLC